MEKLKVVIVITILLSLVHARKSNNSEHPAHPVSSSTSTELAATDPLILISTLDGTLHAVSKRTGTIKWKLDEDPVLNVPMESSTTIKGPTFLPDPHDGSLYAYDPNSEGLTKLPFTIPELVQASPCKSSDGILYTGRKQDVWYAINPTTGLKRRVITTESTSDKCPGGSVQDMFIGRTEYKITMYDTKLNVMRWNVTYMDYSSHINDKVAHSNVLHLASSADGFVITIDRDTGQILWAQNYGYPVVAMYAWVPEGLQKVEMTSVAKETMTYLLKQADGKVSYWDKLFHGNPRFQQPKEATLVPSLYVGQYQYALYALSAMKHDGVQFNAYRNVHMLPGPGEQSDTGHTRTQLEVQNAVTPVWKLLGYHKMPPFSKLNLPKTQIIRGSPPLLEHKLPFEPEQLPQSELVFHSPDIIFESPDISTVTPSSNEELIDKGGSSHEYENAQIHWNEITIVAILTSIITGLLFLIMIKKQSVPTESVHPKQYDALVRVGQITFDPIDILGRGSAGTVVYKGHFDGRRVAVKRVVRDCFSLADREVALLRESDEHPHVIRYHCMERDPQFQYIALELCSNTLQEYVENRQYRCSTYLQTHVVLHQALQGIDHLHNLKIVHRDVKPSNILISEPNKLGVQRVVISDFGLCKKLHPDRISVSLKSGTAGTDGWIAPEMIIDKRNRITQAVDIFSVGCVFYYVICGKHPFGDSLSRQARIVASDYSLDELQEYEFAEEAIDLIKGMLQTDPAIRPKTDTILSHPLFWDSSKKLQFFENVSDRVEKEPVDSITVQQLERDSLNDISNGIPRDWIIHLCRPLQDDLHKFRTYKTDSVRDLLRAIRNKKHHYRELPEEVKQSLGHIPDEYLKYFTSRFPRLLIHTYRSIACCRHEPMFRSYYGKNTPDHIFDSGDDKDGTIFTHLVSDKMTFKKAIKPSLQNTDTSPNKPTRSVKTKSLADQDLDWRSSASRLSSQANQPSNAFKSLYKNNPSRNPNTYLSNSKLNHNAGDIDFVERRDGNGASGSEAADGTGVEFRHIPIGKIRRFTNGSPRVSECSNVSSDSETKSRNSVVHRSRRSSKSSVIAEKNQEKNEIIPCTNSFSSLSLDDTIENGDDICDEAEDFVSMKIENLNDVGDTNVINENDQGKTEAENSSETNQQQEQEEEEEEEEQEEPPNLSKKSKKPRRRRFKKNKAKANTPVSEVVENCVLPKAEDSIVNNKV